MIETKKCRTCDAEIDSRSHICLNCGAKQKGLIAPKLKKCGYCGKDMASNLNACPHCNKTPKTLIAVYSLCAILFVTFFILVIGIISSDNTDSNVTSENVQVSEEENIQITAIELLNSYEKNEINANENYKGKTIIVNGVVSDMGVTEKVGILGGTTYILFDNSGVDATNFTTVQCNFTSEKEIEKIAHISKGQEIYVKGTCTGESHINIILNNCSIIED